MKEPLNRQIVERLLDYIRINRLKADDPLPPENVLIGELAVSRVVLREGLSHLKALGLLTSRRGSGYRISSGSLAGAMSGVLHARARSGLSDLEELYSLRRILELGAIADAVNNADDAAREKVSLALQDLERFESVDDDSTLMDFTLSELKFHQALLEPAACRMLDLVNQALEDFFTRREYWESQADQIVFTGKIDEYYGYRFGQLEYRTVSFELETIDAPNYQGCALVNYTESHVPYTRIIEHKHFESFGDEVYANPVTIISREYSTEWTEGSEPFYPVNDARNNALYQQYKELADQETNVIFGGRLAEYKYYDMAPIIERVLGMFD